MKFLSVSYILKWFFISFLIGILIGSVSAFFLFSLNWITNLREAHIWLISFLPISGFLIGLLYYYYGKNIESGNALLFDTIQNPKNIIPLKLAPFIFISTLASHLFGGSAGREGTALQMAGAISDQLSNPLKLTNSDRKILIIMAVAAGFGAVFGTPFAGAIFAVEVILISKLNYNAFLPAILASLIANGITKFWHITHTNYQIKFIPPPISILNIIYSIFAGILFGIGAAIFCKSIHFTSSIFKSKIKYPPLRPLIGGAIIACLVWSIGTTKYIGLGIPTIVQSFDQQLPFYIFLLKLAFTVITLAACFKGGEVTPLFFIGATLGSALSYYIPLPTSLLAGMGFVAVFAGATNTPLACSIMAIELFGINCGIYVFTACVVAYIFSGYNSIYNDKNLTNSKFIKYTNFIKNNF